MQFLGGDRRKASGQIEPHLVSENGFCPSTRAVRFFNTVVADMAHEIKILLHRPSD